MELPSVEDGSGTGFVEEMRSSVWGIYEEIIYEILNMEGAWDADTARIGTTALGIRSPSLL